MARPDPYVSRNPNDLIRAGDWNEIQTRTREELQAHDHSGAAMGTPIGRAGIQPNAIDGSRIDPASTVTVTNLTVSTTFKVGTRTLLADVDSLLTRATSLESRASALESGKVNRAGDTITGVLRISGSLGVQSTQATLPAQLSLGMNLANTKLALHDDPAGLYGLGVQLAQFRLHIGNTNARFSFLNGPAGTELLTIQGSGLVGIGETNPQRRLHIREDGAKGDWGPALFGPGADRPGIAVLGSYPEIQMFGKAANTTHGATLRLGGYNADLATYKSWSFGVAGQNARFLDIGINPGGDPNPHAGVRNYNGKTVLTLLENGNVGIGNLEPAYALDVNGTVKANRYAGENALVLNDFQNPINPSSNVYLHSSPNDRDSWIFRDSADNGSNWGIYHRQINSDVNGLPMNSIGFIGGGNSALKAYISLQTGAAMFSGGTASVGVTAGRAGSYSRAPSYPYWYESLGVTDANMNLRLACPNWVIMHAAQVRISKDQGGTGDLWVEGNIGGQNAKAVREQLVHRRVLFGYAGDTGPINFGTNWAVVRQTAYAPFGYAVPGVQAGANRRFRIYAVYTDNINPNTPGTVDVAFAFTPSGVWTVFSLPLTWGEGSGSPFVNRDAYSNNWYDGTPPGEHATIYVRATTAGTGGALRYLELQTWDFF